jgi:hypothetical protein
MTSSAGIILAVNIDKGRTHDFNLFKKSKATRKITSCKVLADLGYVGISKICPNSEIPNKKTKKNPLTKRDKKKNRKLSSKRIIIEQINAKIKVFKIVKYPYRNRRKRFGLRMNLISAIINLDRKPIQAKELDA